MIHCLNDLNIDWQNIDFKNYNGTSSYHKRDVPEKVKK